MIIDAFDAMREDRLIGQIEFSDHSNKTKPLLSHSKHHEDSRDFIPTLLYFSSTCWKVIKRESRGELADFNKDSPPVSAQLIISKFLEISWKKENPTEPQMGSSDILGTTPLPFSPSSPLFYSGG